MFIDFARIDHQSAYFSLLVGAHGVRHLPVAVWRPTPPDSSGLNTTFRCVKVGKPPEKWFSPTTINWSNDKLRQSFFLRSTLVIGRLLGRRLPRPEFVPLEKVDTVARWLAEKKAAGTPGYLEASASAATRVCLAANDLGLDISGSVFAVGGEPYTAAKAEVIASAGARAIDRYSLTELGLVGLGCADPSELDDMHLATDKIAVIQRDKVVGAHGATVPALVYTTLHTSCPKLLLNDESGDYGTLRQRRCSCVFDELGLTTHLAGLRSYDKLTSEGVTFMGSELYKLVEEVLPARFGGHTTDYQLVEEEEQGLPRVSVVVSPRVGKVDDEAVLATVLTALDGYYQWGPHMADGWRSGQTLRVVRQEPYAAGGRKVLPLHVLRASSSERPS